MASHDDASTFSQRVRVALASATATQSRSWVPYSSDSGHGSSESVGDSTGIQTTTSKRSRQTMGGSGSAMPVTRRAVVGGTIAGLLGTVPSVSTADSTGGTFRAVTDGDWSDPGTWEGGAVPTDGADVYVQAGVTVTVASRVSARVTYLEVSGTLRFAPDADTRLRAETLWTNEGSRLEIGTAETPIQRDVTAEIEIIDQGPIDEDEWPHRKNKGLIVGGDVEIVGAETTPWTTLARPARAGDTSVELSAEPTNWSAGDRIVLPGQDPYTSTDLTDEDEERRIESVNGTTVELDSALDHDHVPPKSDLDTYALNLSRNVVFFSENTDEHRRGHTMIMSSGSEVRWIRFEEMGRTNKDQHLTNPVRNADEVDADDPNPAARYPLHWHRTGADDSDPHEVEGAVVDGSPGWGIVNHHAHAHVTDSITYDVLGAGFVAEGGNERGSFKRCFALRSRGSGEVMDSRAAGAHGGDPPIDDFGHAGHGFWLQSPLVELVDNVAAGHRHHGIVLWLRPLLDETHETLAECSEVTDSRVTYCPNVPMDWLEGQEPLLEAIEQERFSDNDDLMWDTQKVPSTFVRVKRVEGNEPFGCAGGLDLSRHNFKWKHERFSEFSVIEDLTVYNIGTFYDEDGNTHEPDLPRHRAAGHQGRGGSVGVSFRYTSNVALKDSRSR